LHPKHISSPDPDRARAFGDLYDAYFGEDFIDVQYQLDDDGAAPPTPSPPAAPRPTYPQDWSSYDQAKTHEDSLFKQLLVELVLIAQEERKTKRGRTGHHSWEKILSMCIKEYYKSDLRKTESILRSLHEAALLPRAPGYRSIDRFYNDSAVTPILERLLLISALPLAHLEQTGAMDSTGFSVRKYRSWCEYKWGKGEGRERVWVKLHAWGGTTTNVFVGAKVTSGNVGDAPMFKEVVGNQPRHFKMREFVADKAYSSREIFQFLKSLDLEPYIPFKINAKPDPKGVRIWREMYEFFKSSPQEYYDVYHRRSNIETCFHMLKQRFGHRLLTKNFIANQNEILAKMLCHNICVLIQEAYERGVQINFTAARDEIARPVTK
jgi:transposase